MPPSIIRIIGLICCIAAATVFALNSSGKYLIGSPYTPYFLLGIGVLLLIRAKMTKTQ